MKNAKTLKGDMGSAFTSEERGAWSISYSCARTSSKQQNFSLGVLPAVESGKLEFIVKCKLVIKTFMLLHFLV